MTTTTTTTLTTHPKISCSQPVFSVEFYTTCSVHAPKQGCQSNSSITLLHLFTVVVFTAPPSPVAPVFSWGRHEALTKTHSPVAQWSLAILSAYGQVPITGPHYSKQPLPRRSGNLLFFLYSRVTSASEACWKVHYSVPRP